MNFAEALEALKKGETVSLDRIVYRMKITSWVKQLENDDKPEWHFYYRVTRTNEWKRSNGFSADEVLSDEWMVFEEGEDY